MAELLVEIDCNEDTCGVFNEFTDGAGIRLAECLNAEEVARDLLAEEDEED